MDRKQTKVAIALIIPESKSRKINLGILSEVVRKLMDEDFKKKQWKLKQRKQKFQQHY
ncbi:fructose-specific PTS system IIABC component [Spiroplasma kunkelii CR2-3x]|uniref:Fructose-specific PTS system IIABC component n=2 Tax=Spiroplasma kunkelii TaxID=47834 RepID=A0A0K2JJ54_SPIKU|nr:fructose-specific PTS system IIABC component [Spiroplasma kunkelii CR2-3x]